METTRRTLLSTAAIGLAFAANMKPTSAATQDDKEGSADHIRKDVNLLDPDDPIIKTYRKGVKMMKDLPASNPLSWQHQAEVHLKYCPHGNWFFLPWHRAFLAQFENIIRNLTGAADFALPYWDWTNNPQIPAAFWGPDNPLNHPRNATAMTNMPEEFVSKEVLNDIIEETSFEYFASLQSSAPYNGTGGGFALLEASPHNNVHVTIGGDMITFLSPKDPIFWLHHANIDRIWASWNAQGNVNTPDAALAGFTFSADQPDRGGVINPSQFVDPTGQPINYRIGDMYCTCDLGYEYQNLVTPEATEFLLANRQLTDSVSTADTQSHGVNATVENGDVISATFTFDEGLLSAVADTGRTKLQTGSLNESDVDQGEINIARLEISGIIAPDTETDYIRVFLNCDYLSVDTPTSDPHYVGAASFFLIGGHGDGHAHDGGTTYAFDLTETIDALRRSGRPVGETLKPQIFMVDKDGRGASLSVRGEMTIEIQQRG